MVLLAPVTRSGGCSRCAAPPSPRGTPASRRRRRGRTGGRRDPSAGRAKSGVCRSGEDPRPPKPCHRSSRAAFGAPRPIHGPSRTRSRPEDRQAIDSHGAAFPRTHRADAGDRSSCQHFQQRKSRASPLVARLARALLHHISGGPGPFPQAFPAAPRRAPNQGPRHNFRRHTGVQY